MNPTQIALECAAELGFDLAGVAPLAPPPDAAHFEDWLDQGCHAGMDYLERQRERILDPRLVLPEGKSLLVLGMGHSRPDVELPGGGKLARYAAGRDYHNLIGKRLRKLERRLREAGLIQRARSVVDSGPLLERSHAAQAGVGAPSKAANLLAPGFGPYFFLSEVIVDTELEPTEAPTLASCGTCTACIDACPTAAITEPGRVDARRCISYHTIENRSPSPHELRESFGDWAFGCDICSQVCPWAKNAPDLSERFGIHPAVAEFGLVEWLELPALEAPSGLSETWRGSALQRPKREGLARNAAIALGNVPLAGSRRALLKALSFDPSPMVREASAWALARAHGSDAGVNQKLDAALQQEQDNAARAGMRNSLDRYR